MAAPRVRPAGRRTLGLIRHGAAIGEQHLRAMAAARALLAAGYSIEATAAARWRGRRASPWAPGREPWTAADAWRSAADLASRPAPPLQLLQPLQPLERTRPGPRARGREGSVEVELLA